MPISPQLQGKVVTVSRYIMEQERHYPHATGEFSSLLSDIMLAAKMIQREVSKAGLLDALGKTGTTNVQGEEVQKLDAYANRVIFQALDHTGHLCVMASEEDEAILSIPSQYPCGKYVLNYDPLDGSSNIDANVSIGTIFSIHHRLDTKASGPGCEKDCMQPGSKQICAGYLVYGSSTMLVYSTGQGVHGFTYDPSVGEFLMSHEDIKIPKRGKIYSVNEGNYNRWDDGTRAYIDHLREEAPPRPYTSRYIGSLVADFHRTLLYGGIFLYPSDRKNPQGKLRLLYEAAPLAFIVEQAGGMAIDGKRRILDVQPSSLHERTPLIIGSEEDVQEYARFVS